MHLKLLINQKVSDGVLRLKNTYEYSWKVLMNKVQSIKMHSESVLTRLTAGAIALVAGCR